MPREYLTSLDTIVGKPRRDEREDPGQTTQEVGDPDAGSTASDAQEGAAGGGLLGTAVAGPLGLAVGAAVGAAAGAAKGVADDDEPSRRDRATRQRQASQAAADRHDEDDSDPQEA